MTSVRKYVDTAVVRAAHVLTPLATRWNSLPSRNRSIASLVALLVLVVLILSFVLFPAMEQRRTLAARLPQLEAQLAMMRGQAKEVASLADTPANAAAPRTIVNIAALQSIFGPNVQITAVQDGFRVVVAAVSYESWWDKTSDAVSRHALVLREASLVRLNDSAAGPSAVAVDMRLGTHATVAGLAAEPTPPSTGK